MKGKTRAKSALRAKAIAVALSLVMALALCACKPTDFFIEVVITPFSDVVDEKNSQVNVVNSPDATEESAKLTALDWTDESPQSLDVENLTTYSDAPVSTLTTHHSIFDIHPRFPGIMASDAVRLVFDNKSDLDHESEADELDESILEAVSRSAGGSESQDSGEVAPSEAVTGEGAGEGILGEGGGDAEEAGGDPDGSTSDPGTPGEGTGPGDSDGTEEDPYGGYNGEVAVYNPGDGFARVNRVDHLAVLGTDVAVLAQSLGGAGAICAMNEYAWYGLDAMGVRTTTYASFVDVFSGEMPAGFEQGGLLWSADGARPANVRSIDALIAACGQKGVIVYDQTMGTSESLFSLDQRRRLQASEIQLVPVDMSTVQGMLDAAQVIGEALSESEECVQDALAMSRSYIRAVNDIVRSVAATNGGWLAQRNAAGSSLLTAYNSPPVTNTRYLRTFGYIATDSEQGLRYTGGSIDASGVTLFGNNSAWMSTPLSFWMQAAGVHDNTTGGYPYTGLMLFWPFYNNVDQITTTLVGGQSGGAWSRWLGSSYATLGPAITLINGEDPGRMATVGEGWGLGSAQVPYLIVCASGGKTAAEVKGAVVDSMLSYDSGGPLTPYSVLPYSSSFIPLASVGDNTFVSTIGSTNGNTHESPFYMAGLAVDSVVRENPVGLLGSWIEGNMESVLEAIWLADIYSKSPAGCDYDPITSMSRFSVDIGGVTCTTTRAAVLQFYQTFYRCDASAAYEYIVTDEGL
jgi:hypothetical protein